MAIIDLAVIGLAVTLEPIPVTAFILVLSTKRGTLNGAFFIFGWLLSLAVVVVGVVLITGGKPPAPSTAPSDAVLSIKIFLGAALIAFAIYRQRRSDRPHKPAAWMAKLENLSVWAAAGLGVLVQPWPLVAAGAATVSQLQVASLAEYAILVGFCILCTSSFGAMEVHALMSPDVARQRLERLRLWIDTHRDQVIILLSLIVGFWLVGSSSYLIAT